MCVSLLACYDIYIYTRSKSEKEIERKRENLGKNGTKLDLLALVRKTHRVVCQNLYKSIDLKAVHTTFSAFLKILFMKCFLLPLPLPSLMYLFIRCI